MMNFTTHLWTKQYKFCTNTWENPEGETCLTHFFVASMNLISKPDKEITIEENYTSVYHMNMHASILNKILANQI